jgi:peptidoglycan/xylan/chitin deacetylase (PgdA/CDA1 family)
MFRRTLIATCVATLACAKSESHAPAGAAAQASSPAATASGGEVASSPSAARGGTRAPNEMGRIPVLEYHLIGDKDTRWTVDREHFKRTLQLMYDRGYRPVNMTQVLDKHIDLPAGLSPVVLVFDDASPSQFRYIENGSQLEIDPNSAVAILLDFHRAHPDWENRAVFCTLSGAAAGHNFFGDRGIEGQKSQWRFRKLQFLRDQGFELCNHTLWHAQLSKYPDAFVQEQIARGQLAIDSAVPGYKVRTFALPQGLWPKNKPLAWQGSWTDPKSGRTIAYHYDAVLEVAGGPTRSPYDPQFDGHHILRVEAFANEVERMLDRLDATNARYVSAGRGHPVASAGR